MTVSLNKTCGKQFWRLNICYILLHKSQHCGRGLANNTFWQSILVFCQSRNTLQVNHYGDNLLAQSE